MLLNDALTKLILRLCSIREDLPLDATEVTRLQGAYRIQPSHPSEARKHILIQDAKAFLLVDLNHKIQKFILPIYIDAGTYYASLGDDLRESSPVKVDDADFGKFVMTVSRQDDVLAAGLGHLSELDHAPGNSHAPDGTTCSPDLAFPSDIGGTQVFCPVPKVLPMGRADAFPNEGIDLTKPLSAELLATLPAHVRAYVIGMWWLCQHNESKSLHEHPSAYKTTEVPITSFTNAGLVFAVDAEIEWTTGALQDVHTTTYKDRFRTMRKRIARDIYDANPSAYEDEVEVLNKDPADPTSDTTVASAVAAAVAGVFTKNKKESEAPENAKMEDTKAFYRIFGAKTTKILQEGGGSIETLVPTQLGDAFLEVLSEPKTADAVRIFHRRWSEMTETFDRAPIWQFLHRYDIEVWQNASMVGLKHCVWANRSFDLDPHDAKTKLSIFAFGPPNIHDPLFKAHKKDNDLCNLEDAMGEDKTKQTKKKTELYLPRFSNTFNDLKIMLANNIVFWAFVTGDYTLSEPPLIVKLFINAIKLISDERATGFDERVGAKHLPISIALGLNRVLQCFVGAARNSKNIQALRAGSLHDPLILASGVEVYNRLSKQIDQCFFSVTYGDFRDVPPFAKYICGDCTPESTSDADKRDSSSQSSSNDSTPPKKTKQDKKDLGIFAKDGPGRVTYPQFKVKGDDGKERTVCMNFAMVGRECNRGRRCDLAHLTKQKLSIHPQREQFNKYVRETSNIKYADGVELPPVRNCSSGISTLAMEFDDFGSSSMPIDPDPPLALPQHMHLVDGDRTTSRTPEAMHRFDREYHDRWRPYHKVIFQGVDHTPHNLREDQERVLSQVPTPVRLAVESPYGKDSIDRCFATEKTFRHTWIYLFKSCLLLPEDLDALFRAFTPALLLWKMLQEHALVDFRDLKKPIPTGKPAGSVMHRWSRMFSACLLHFNLDLPSAIRYVGHIHTGSHRDWNLLESTLKAAKSSIDFINSVRRVYFDGCPNYVNATSTEANRRAYAEYGNHPSVYQWESLTKKALQKDMLRSYTLLANPALSPFMPNIHLNPQGMVVPEGKNPRQICDESFHPQLDSMAANDWVDIANEPEIIFPLALMVSLIWLYNLRMSHPFEELYIGDDDVSGAFRHAKFNPNVVGLHAFMLFGFMFFATGQTFGGEPGPSNWEVLAMARMEIARYLWSLASTIQRAAPFLPKIETTPKPTPAEIAAFVPAEPDSINQGVLNADGSRKPPEFRHHVDDCMYADTKTHLLQTVSASVLALYIVLGFPDKARGIRDCVSWEKFQSKFSYERKTLGWIINSRRLTLSLPETKRDNLIVLLKSVIKKPSRTIREIAVLLGHLDNATTVKRDMKCSYFNLGRLMKALLWQRYHAARNWCRRNNREVQIKRLLPKQFQYRLGGIISRQVTDFLWNSGQKVCLGPKVLAELSRIKHSLETEPWEIYIAQIIPRDPHFKSQGDASLTAGGAYCISLNYWFRVVWSPELFRRCHLPDTDPKYVHINTLEFMVSMLQAVAAVVTFEDCEHLDPTQLPSFLAATFPGGLPRFPVLEAGTDNTSTESWTGSVRTTSVLARAMVHLFGQLLARTDAVVKSKYIPGVDNIVPDFISRPDQIISHELLLDQTYQSYPWLKSLRFFRPSPELVSVLRSSLFCDSNQALPEMPKQLGHFVPAGSTTSAFVLI